MNALTPQAIVTISHWAVAFLLLLAALAFIAWFWVPAWRLGRELKRSTAALLKIKGAGPVVDLEAVKAQAMITPQLQHAWSEYRDTLHGQQGMNAQGEMRVARWRATATAQSFFTEQALVDTRLRSEFFKHLPGLLTGLGIIGTFSGLILGLQAFNVSDKAEEVRDSLQGLLNAVGGAFIVSASAIGMAMITTLVEKVLISKRYAQLESLCSVLDSLFDSGAGEEYLARLVQASETQATQAQHIKDALVSDLKGILTELTERQMATVTATNQQLGQALSQTISDSLRQPLEDISGAVRQVAGSQGDAVNRMLTDVLASFAGRMESMFGGQLSGMNELLGQTATTMQSTAQRFEALAAKIEQAGSGAAEQMASRMESLMQTMGERQAESNAQMAQFVEQLRGMVAQGQSETAELMQSTFAELSETSAALVKQLQSQSANSAAEVQRSTEAFSARAGEALAQQGAQLEQLTEAVQEASRAMTDSTARMRQGIDENVSRLGSGAETLLAAARKLQESLGDLSGSMAGMGDGVSRLTEAASTLHSVSTVQQQALGEQRQVRDAIGAMVVELRHMVEAASRDAGTNAKLVASLEGAAGKLAEAQDEAGQYLEEVTDTLAKVHESFAHAVTSTLQRGNAEFQKELGRAVDVLRGAIQDLGDTLDALPVAAR